MGVWFRYVDDIFAVFDTKAISLDNFVVKLNNHFPTIKFTYEMEHNEQLPFLDVLLIRNSENKLEFDRTLYNSTTFRRETDNSKIVSLPHEPKFTRGLDKIFKNNNINLVSNSKNKLQTLLGNPKDKIDNNENSGIYEISCKDCDQKYIGQTKRSILTRFKEHMAHLKYGRTEKSCVVQHAFDNNHRIDINNLKLIRNIRPLKISSCAILLVSIHFYPPHLFYYALSTSHALPKIFMGCQTINLGGQLLGCLLVEYQILIEVKPRITTAELLASLFLSGVLSSARRVLQESISRTVNK
ncbi:hypothetical protein NQ318_018815 [Aromia moschata]|uniref:GIY-YIG domain-containing protein n=1 Tax=Aromia moschata TaxID=1265417 RepID=A0AAV8ZGL1_9CUCU|nr:hypothetical protein NQ318_018815 [Aromia moschata]